MLKDYDFLFIGDWQRGWNFWSVPGFKQALIESYDYTGEAPLGLLMFVPKTAPDEEAAQ